MLPSPRRSPRGGGSPYSLPPRPFPARASLAASPQPSPRPDAAPPAPTADEQWAELERAAAVFRTAPQRRQPSGEGADLAPDSAAPAAAKQIPQLPPLPPAAAPGGGRTPRTPRTPRTRAQVVPLSAEDDDAADVITAQAGPPAGPITPASPRRGRGGGPAAPSADVAAGSLRALGFASGTTRSADVAQRDAALHTARDALFAAQLAPRWPAARSGDHKAAAFGAFDDPAARESAWVLALLALRRPARAVAADVARAALLGAYLLTGAAVAFAALYRVDGATGRIQPL